VEFSTPQQADVIRKSLEAAPEGSALFLFAARSLGVSGWDVPDRKMEAAPRVARAAADFERAARTPGLHDHHLLALEYACIAYVLAGSLSGDENLFRKGAELAHERTSMKPPPPEEVLLALWKAVHRGGNHALARLVLDDWERRFRPTSYEYRKGRAITDFHLGAYQSAREWFEKLSPDEMRRDTDRASVIDFRARNEKALRALTLKSKGE
jgi:hypothetical protein